ncbi:hypothetical protein HRI_004517300 [Hibiscus trionum]|uniref:Uncharacterized protein n=1 Tax=Hibiscus trionum TaxID=183268 RepID=A0A9W7J4L8_HIBTR|nr:hypothetical protein HRI_004517300 [Hibiscus trionum]
MRTGVRNAAQRKLLDELGIPAEDDPVDQFTSLGCILYKAPSDANGASMNLITSYSSSGMLMFTQIQMR